MIDSRGSLATSKKSRKLGHIRRYLQSNNGKTREHAIAELEDIPGDEAFELLLAALDDDNRRVKSRAVEALGYRKDPRALDRLLPLFGARPDTNIEVINGTSGEIETIRQPWPIISSNVLIEAVGRIGDTRAVEMLVRDDIDFSHGYEGKIAVSWALASVAANTHDLEALLRIARRLVLVFPSERVFNWHLIGQMPWPEIEMLDIVSKLLSDSEAEIRCRAAMLLALYGDSRGANVLVEQLNQPEPDNEERRKKNLGYLASEALVILGDRRVLDILIDLLSRPSPPEFAVRSLGYVLRRWEDTLTALERERLTAAVPVMIGFLKHGDIYPDIVEGVRRIHSETADMLMDAWLNDEVYNVFAPFILSGEASELSDEISDLSLISRSQHAPGAKIASHPLTRRYAFPALKARYEYLQSNPGAGSIDWILACIGWLGDPQALPFLYEELERCRTDDLEDLYGEIVYAIANIGQPESGEVLVACLKEKRREAPTDVFKPIRDYVRQLRDENILTTLLQEVEEEDFLWGEMVEAIGENGSAVGAPALIRLLSNPDAELAEAITALGHIAVQNANNVELASEITASLEALLTDNRKINLGFLYPQATAPIAERADIALRMIKARDSRWRNAPSLF